MNTKNNLLLKNIFGIIFIFIFLTSLTFISGQKKISVKSAEEIKSAIKKAEVGTIIEVADGVYDLGELLIEKLNGKKNSPIVLKSKNTGKVEFSGATKIIIRYSGNFIIQGFLFTGYDGPAVLLDGSNNVRVTKNIFRLKEKKNFSWVFIKGNDDHPEYKSHHNRVDHNLFEQKSLLGNFITVEGNLKPVPLMSQYDRIDHNHFKDIGPRVENVLEAIRHGSAPYTLSSGNSVIEYNLFERCDGDPEVVSIKCCDMITRYNTFRECLGVMSLRHGNRNTVEGNFFLGNGRSGSFTDSTKKSWILGTGGVRFCGDDMKIINNYFEGLTGKEWDAPLSMTNGDAEYGMGLPLTKHYRTRKSIIAFNTFVNNDHNIEIGFDGAGFQGNVWNIPPIDCVIANNIIVGSKGELIKIFTEPVNTKWNNNIAFPTGKALVGYKLSADQMKIIEPKLERKDGLLKLTKSSHAINAAYNIEFPVIKDIDGQLRDKKKDIGADEFSILKISIKPLTPNDVGPFSK